MKLYGLLGVPPGAGEQEIRAAYRRIALRCHPDRTQGDPAAEALFHEATEAYRILTNPGRRRRYEEESAPVETVADLFERRPAGKRLLKASLPSAKNAPKAGRSTVRIVVAGQPGTETGTDGRMTVRPPAGDLRPPVTVGAMPPGLAAEAAWYEIEGAGEPGRNNGEPGTLWMMIIDKGDTHAT